MQSLELFGIPLLYVLAVVAFLLPRIPVVGKFFNIINTLIHELGHALMALLLGGEILQIQIFSDTSGVTVTKSKSKFKAFLVSLAGYTFASAAAYLCFYLLSVGREEWIILGTSAIFIIMLIFWIRNRYGLIWVIIYTLLNAVLIFWVKNTTVTMVVAWFYSLMILLESVWSSLVLLWLSLKDGNHAGDATNLKKFTHIPAFFWSLLFTAFAGYMSYLSLSVVGHWPFN
ncbi:MAG: M50 family metallopeptidase [Bacteroidales bacterium]|jgi:hypothetical protein|nr:M50 family metallopeptidase [Bacteroidales bacterium]